MARETIIHIGFHKTGTKSIQKLLENSAPDMAQQNILLPSTKIPLRRLLSDMLLWDDIKFAFPWREKSISGIDLTKAAHGLQTRIRDWPGRVIVSSEVLSFANENNVRRIVDFFSAASGRVTILAYVRPQLASLVSWACQEVRTGRVVGGYCPTPYQAIPRRTDVLCALDYSGILALWTRAVGPANVVVRLFQRDMDSDWDVAADFMSVLNATTSITGSLNLNQAISPAAIEFLNRMNGALPIATRLKNRGNFIKSLPSVSLPAIGADQAQAILRCYYDSNKKLDAMLPDQDRGKMNGFLPSFDNSADWPYQLRPEMALDLAALYLQSTGLNMGVPAMNPK